MRNSLSRPKKGKGLVAQAVELSLLRTKAELDKVLAHPLLVVRGDAAGIAREMGVITSGKRLQKLAARVASEARARALLEAHGIKNLQGRNRVTDGGRAPMEVEDAPAAPPLPTGRTADAAGPLPVEHVRLPREQAAARIEEQPPVNGGNADGDGADGDGADGGGADGCDADGDSVGLSGR